VFRELRQASSPDCISDLRFDTCFAEELAPDELTSLREHLAQCARCQARQAWLVEQRRRFAEANALPAWLAPVQVDARSADKPRLRWTLTASLMSAAACALVVFGIGILRGEREPTLSSARSKGGQYISFFVKRGADVRRGTREQPLHPGDKLRFTYTTAAARYLAILSLDSRRRGSVYYPSGQQAARIAPGVDVALPSAVELDDAVGAESIFALFCESAIELAPIVSALEAQPFALPPAPGCTIERLAVTKEAASK
jgi:hypothetical protein